MTALTDPELWTLVGLAFMFGMVAGIALARVR